MATKEKTIASNSGSKGSAGSGSLIPPELFQFGSYKPSQGRTVRMVTAITFGVIMALSAWRLYETLVSAAPGVRWGASAGLLAIGWWLSFRIVNVARFADFLIAVEAEMTKVSWPTQTELRRASAVVIIFIVSLASVLFLFDLVWQKVFQLIGIIG